MSGVFQNIDPPTPSLAGACVLPAFGAGGGHNRWVERGGGWVNILEDARHCSVLYIRKYFVLLDMGERPHTVSADKVGVPRRLFIPALQ